MAWVVLIVSAVFEAVWATALGKSNGLSEPGPTVVFVLGLALSMIGLSVAMRRIPLGVAYCVWIGIGAALTVVYAMAAGDEPVSPIRIVLLTGIVGCVVGLKLVGHPAQPAPPVQTLGEGDDGAPGPAASS